MYIGLKLEIRCWKERESQFDECLSVCVYMWCVCVCVCVHGVCMYGSQIDSDGIFMDSEATSIMCETVCMDHRFAVMI